MSPSPTSRTTVFGSRGDFKRRNEVAIVRLLAHVRRVSIGISALNLGFMFGVVSVSQFSRNSGQYLFVFAIIECIMVPYVIHDYGKVIAPLLGYAKAWSTQTTSTARNVRVFSKHWLKLIPFGPRATELEHRSRNFRRFGYFAVAIWSMYPEVPLR